MSAKYRDIHFTVNTIKLIIQFNYEFQEIIFIKTITNKSS
jgi:hypothetical protein